MFRRKIIISFIAIVLSLSYTIYSSGPLVSIPVAENNYVNLSDPDSMAIYNFYIYNPTTENYSLQISILSPSWIAYINNYSHLNLYYDTIAPGGTKEFKVYLRPVSKTLKIPELLIVLKNKETYKYVLSFNPLVYQQTSYNETIIQNISSVVENITFPLLYSFYLSEYKIYPGEILYIFLLVNNPNNVSKELYINISTDFGYSETYFQDIPPLTNLNIQIPIPISINTKEGTYYLNLTINNVTYNEKIEVLSYLNNIKILENKTSYFLGILSKMNIKIINENEFAVLYNISVKVGPTTLFTIFNIRPNNIIYRDGNYYAIYELNLIPKETYILKADFNYLLFISLLVLIILAVYIFVFYVLIPNVEVSKEIIRVDLKENKVSISIKVKNKSLFDIKDIKITDYVPKPMKVENYLIVEPSSIYKSPDKYILNWKYDKLGRGEEIVISYELNIEKLELDKPIEIPRASITYKYLYKTETKYTSANIIKVVK